MKIQLFSIHEDSILRSYFYESSWTFAYLPTIVTRWDPVESNNRTLVLIWFTWYQLIFFDSTNWEGDNWYRQGFIDHPDTDIPVTIWPRFFNMMIILAIVFIISGMIIHT